MGAAQRAARPHFCDAGHELAFANHGGLVFHVVRDHFAPRDVLRGGCDPDCPMATENRKDAPAHAIDQATPSR
jgi:hypothetical protein